MVGRLFNRPGGPKHEFPQQSAPNSPSGHYLWPLQQVRIIRVEQILQPNHSSPLFFGRSTVVTQAGQPFFLWQSAPRISEPEAIAWTPDHNLHRFRTTFQTVGQPWSTWAPYRQPAVEPEQIRPVQADLHPYRQFAPAATAKQPFWIWQGSRVELLPVEPTSLSDHSLLHRYRTSYQTVGQPWNALWQAYQPPSFEPEWIIPPQFDLLPYRQITVAPPLGQPWYLWPPIKVTVEPQEVVLPYDHAGALYPFLPHPALPPAPPVDTGVPAPVGHPVYYLRGRRRKARDYEDSHVRLRAILDSIGRAEVEEEQPVAAVAKPAVAVTPLPAPARITRAQLQDDLTAFQSLLSRQEALWEKRLQEEEEELILSSLI